LDLLAGQAAGDKKPADSLNILHSRAGITKAQKLLGWTPRVDFREGIEKAVAWYRQQQ
jgi:nucleoside-diphosphate-sugar epimerase